MTDFSSTTDLELEKKTNVREPTPAPQPSAWREAPGGYTRENPAAKVTETVTNEGGNVYSQRRAYTPPPVNPKKSYAEALLTEIPSRERRMQQKLATGDIPGATAERTALESYVDENREALHRFTSYRGTDVTTHAAAGIATRLATGAWMDDKTDAMFNPKLNPESAKFDAMTLGMSPDTKQMLSAARYGTGPEASKAALVMSYVRDDTIANAEKAQAMQARTGIPQPEAMKPAAGRPNDWVSFYNEAESFAKSNLPAPVMAGMSADEFVSTVRTGFEAGGKAAGLDLVRLAARGAADPATFKSNLGANREALSAWTAAGGDDDRWLKAGTKVLAAVQGALPSGSLAANRTMATEIATETAGYRKIAENNGQMFDDASTERVATALAKRRSGRSDLTGDESATLRTIDSMKQLVSNVIVGEDPIVAAMGGADPVSGPGKSGQPPPPGVHDLFRDEMRKAVGIMGVAALADGRPIEEHIDRAAPVLAERFMLSGRSARPVAEAAARVSLRILSRQKSFDVRNVNAEIAKYPELVEEARQATMESIVERPKEAVKDFKELAFRVGTTSIDGLVVQAIQELEAGRGGDAMPGDPEYNQAVKSLKSKGVGTWANRLTGSGAYKADSSDAIQTLFEARADKLESSDVQAKAKKAFVDQAFSSDSVRLATKIGKAEVEALADAFVKLQTNKIRNKLVVLPKDLMVRDALGQAVLSWNSGGAKDSGDKFNPAEIGQDAGLLSGDMPMVDVFKKPSATGVEIPKSGPGGDFDFAEAATYMFLNKALQAGAEPGLKPYVPVSAAMLGTGSAVSGAAGRAFAAGSLATKATAASAKVFLESGAAAALGATESAVNASTEAAALTGRGLMVAGRFSNALAVAGLGGSILYDALSKSQVPVDSRGIANRIKSFALVDFELPDPDKAGRAAAEALPGSQVLKDVFAPAGQAKMAQAARPAQAAQGDPIITAEERGMAKDIKNALQNTAAALNKPIMDRITAQLLSRKGFEDRFGGTRGLNDEFLARAHAEAIEAYTPEKPPKQFYNEIGTINSKYAAQQRATNLAYLQEQAKVKEIGKAEGKPDDENANVFASPMPKKK